MGLARRGSFWRLRLESLIRFVAVAHPNCVCSAGAAPQAGRRGRRLLRPIPLSDISLATAARVFGCCLLYLCLRCHCCPLCIACDAASDQGVPLTSHARVAYHHLPAGAARPGALRPWRLGGRWAASLRFRTALVSTHLVRPLGR